MFATSSPIIVPCVMMLGSCPGIGSLVYLRLEIDYASTVLFDGVGVITSQHTQLELDDIRCRHAKARNELP